MGLLFLLSVLVPLVMPANIRMAEWTGPGSDWTHKGESAQSAYPVCVFTQITTASHEVVKAEEMFGEVCKSKKIDENGDVGLSEPRARKKCQQMSRFGLDLVGFVFVFS